MRMIHTYKKVVTVVKLLKQRDFNKIGSLTLKRIRSIPYKIRARFYDLRLGGVSLERTIPSKYAEFGSKPTQSTDYRVLDRVFNAYPLKEDDIFIDVGCGEGRVLSYLYLIGVRNRMIGVEIDSDIAEIAKKRTVKCKNIEVVCANVLEHPDLIKCCTAIYIFNPFNEAVLIPFIDMIEKQCKHRVTLYYLCDIYRKYLDKRDKWKIVRRDRFKIPGEEPFPFTVYRYLPDSSC